MTIFSKWSDSDHYHFDMIYDCRFEIRENFSSRELFWLLNRFWSRDRRDGRCNFRPCGLLIFVSKRKSNFSWNSYRNSVSCIQSKFSWRLKNFAYVIDENNPIFSFSDRWKTRNFQKKPKIRHVFLKLNHNLSYLFK